MTTLERDFKGFLCLSNPRRLKSRAFAFQGSSGESREVWGCSCPWVR